MGAYSFFRNDKIKIRGGFMVFCDFKERKIKISGDIRDVLDEIMQLLAAVNDELKNDGGNVDNEISK